MGKPIKIYPLSLKIILITFLITFFLYSCGTIDQWMSLSTQALKLAQQGQYPEAEKAYKEAVQLAEKNFGPDSKYVANSLNGLAELYRAEKRYAEAEPLYKRSLEISEEISEKDFSGLWRFRYNMANSLNGLAKLYRTQGKYAEAETLYKQEIDILEKLPRYIVAVPPVGNSIQVPNTLALFSLGNSLNNLADLYRVQGKYTEAEPLYKRSLKMMEKALGLNHPSVADVLDNLAMCCRKTGKLDEAENLEVRARKIRINLYKK
jgi:tetratricopeptide (TPR) repeat protein